MARFALVYSVDSNRRLSVEPVPYHIAFPGGSLTLTLAGRSTKEEGAPLAGFMIEANTDAATADLAIERTQPLVELFVYSMMLASPGRYERPHLDLVMPVGEHNAELLESYEIGLPPRPSEEIDLAGIAAAYSAFMAPTADNLPMWRLEHAASWLTNGLRSGDRASRLSFVYTGLDVLNEMLQDAGIRKRVGQSQGVAGWLSSRHPDIEELARRARNDVVHGNFRIADLHKRLEEIDHPLVTALRDAIWRLLGKDAPPWEPDALDSGVPYNKLEITLRGQIHAGRYARLADANHPYPGFGATIDISKQEALPDGRLRLTLEVEPKPRVGAGVRLFLRDVDVKRPKDVEVVVRVRRGPVSLPTKAPKRSALAKA